MKNVLRAMTIVIMSAAVWAQQIDDGGFGVPAAAGRTGKPAHTAGRAPSNLRRRPENNLPAKTASNGRLTDLSQISSFSFQEPYSTYLSYYASCPFVFDNGNLFVVYAGPYEDKLYSVTSSDAGSTWTEPKLVRASGSFRHLSGVRTSTGRIVIVWASTVAAGSAPLGLSSCYSDDSGSTWSSVIPISNNAEDLYPTLTQTLDGALWLCYDRYNSGTNYDGYYRKSADNGITWSDEGTFAETPFNDIYAAVVSKDASTIMSVYANDSSGNYDIYSKTSIDNGATWSAPVAIANTSTTETRPRVLRQSDGTLWLVYQHYRNSTGGFTQSEIAYRKSANGGNTWSPVSYLTRYAGYDGWINACLKNDQPFVTFASNRWTVVWQGQTHLWYGLAGTSVDDSPPPTLTFFSNSTPAANSAVSIRAYVDDESGISGVQLYYRLNGTQYGPVQMVDDGMHDDAAAGDKIFGAAAGPFLLGDVIDYSFAITDVNLNAVNVYATSFEIASIHDSGNIVLLFKSNSELADNGASTGSCAYWPKTNGDDYLYDGGLWIGCNVGGQNLVVRQFYGDSDWIRSGGTPYAIAAGVSDQDGDVTYNDGLASPPIGLRVHQESFQWSNATRDDFIIFQYTITNQGVNGTLDNLYVGLWTDPDVAFRTDHESNYVGYDGQRRLVYAYNVQGLPPGCFGVKLLGSTADPSTVYAWRMDQINETTDVPYYQCLTHGGVTLPDLIGDVRMLIVPPPFSLAPGSSKAVAFGIVLGDGLAELQAHADTMEAVFDGKIKTPVDESQALDAIPVKCFLNQNYPNPFNPSTVVSFGLPGKSFVSLKIYDLLGRETATLVNEEMAPGYYSKEWKNSSLPGGVYLYKLSAGNFVVTRKLVILR